MIAQTFTSRVYIPLTVFGCEVGAYTTTGLVLIQTDDFTDGASRGTDSRFDPTVVFAVLTFASFTSAIAYVGCLCLLQKKTIWTQDDGFDTSQLQYLLDGKKELLEEEGEVKETSSFLCPAATIETSTCFKYYLYLVWAVVFGGFFQYVPAIQPYSAAGYE